MIIPNNQEIDFNSLNQIIEIKNCQFKKNKLTNFIYQTDKSNNETKIFGNNFISLNKKKSYLIIKTKDII